MFQSLVDVKYRPTPRFTTCIPELDWIYGGDGDNWGLPQGMISLWSGPSGTGKSRSLIEVARKMSSIGHRVMYFQNEVNVQDFRGWVGSDNLPKTFYSSEETSLDAQISDIIASKATLAIVDSVNQIDEFGNGHKSAIKNIYDRYRVITKKTGLHVIFICQLDKQNMIKGGSELLFLADISMDLGHHIVNKQKVDGYFTISVGSKHRYGKMGDNMKTIWMHSKSGAQCISSNRQMDKDWCDAHKLELVSSEESLPKCTKKAPKGHHSEPIFDDVSKTWFFIPKKISLPQTKIA